jgi:hypothetical protein
MKEQIGTTTIFVRLLRECREIRDKVGPAKPKTGIRRLTTKTRRHEEENPEFEFASA